MRLTKDVRNPCGDLRVRKDLTRIPVFTEELVFRHEKEDTGRVTPSGEPIIYHHLAVRDQVYNRAIFEEGSDQWEAVKPFLVEEEQSVREWMRERGLRPNGCFAIICVLIEEEKIGADDVMDVLRRFHTEGLRRL